MKHFGLTVALALFLASCGDDTGVVEEADEDATARGEVLGGTITDDMLPLDTVTSQSPPRDPEPDETGGSNGRPDTAQAQAAGQPSVGEEEPEAETATDDDPVASQ